METSITGEFGLTTPIISAGMAFVAGPPLAAAVSNAGGLGMLGGAMVPPEGVRMMIKATRAMTDKPFGIDLIGDFLEPAHIDVVIEEQVPIVVFFWTGPGDNDLVRLREAKIHFWMQIGTVAEAVAAAEAGAEALIVQGSQAGGHNRADAPLVDLFRRVKAALPQMPLICAGGIKDGQTMARALDMGAEAVWCGTRFLMANEANAHPEYQDRVRLAGPGDTIRTTLFGPEWPGQMARVLKNKATETGFGRETEALSDAEGQLVGSVELGGEKVPVPKYSAILPTPEMEADLDWVCLTVGECAGDIDNVLPAAEIVREMVRDAEPLLRRN